MNPNSMFESFVDAHERTNAAMVAPALVEEAAFPVTWGHPMDATYTYFFDPMHFPRPVSPLFASVVGPAFEYGFTKAAREFDAPILGARVAVQNHYYFNAFIPDVPESNDEARAIGERAEATMRIETGRLMERWKREHLPQIKARLARLEDMEIATATRDEIPGLLDEVLEIWSQNWATHFRIVIPMMIAMQVFDEYFMDLFEATEQDAHALLIVNDRLDVAIASGADGVHLGQDDLPLDVARGLAPELILGASTHSVDQALAAQQAGADYVNIGPIFSTQTKAVPAGIVGPELIDAILPRLQVRATAMGGIKVHNVDQVVRRGVKHPAVVTAVTQAPDVRSAVADLRAAMVRATE